MSEELKPCPCCGESAELMCPSGLSWWVRCSNKSCGMATKIAYSPDPVVTAWNRRTEAALAKREAVALIERDEGMDRDYIPLPGGWEVQTKGKGSTFRVCDTKSGRRWPIHNEEYGFNHAEWERMAREIHAASQQAAKEG